VKRLKPYESASLCEDTLRLRDEEGDEHEETTSTARKASKLAVVVAIAEGRRADLGNSQKSQAGCGLQRNYLCKGGHEIVNRNLIGHS